MCSVTHIVFGPSAQAAYSSVMVHGLPAGVAMGRIKAVEEEFVELKGW
jgi:hypothetical protein